MNKNVSQFPRTQGDLFKIVLFDFTKPKEIQFTVI